MKPLGVLFILLIAGCSFQVETISADQNAIALKSGRAANPGHIAQGHCAQYGRTARLQGIDLVDSRIYYFVCLE